MVPIGIIFYVCLAFALAILLLIGCCVCKVSKKDSDDVERIRPDSTNRLQTTYNKAANDNRLSSHSHNVILFLNKKDKYNNEKHDPRNCRRNIDDVDNDYHIGLSDTNEDSDRQSHPTHIVESNHQYHGNQGNHGNQGHHSSGNHQPAQSTSFQTSQASNSHGFHSHHHSHHDHGHSNGGFTSSCSHDHGGHGDHHDGDHGGDDGGDD